MNAIARAEPAQIIQAPSSNAASLMEVISRAASDPNTDVDKLERLMSMYERITSQQAKAAFTSALAELQPKLPVIDQKGKISTDRGKTVQSTYAKYEDINEAVQPILADHGFALTFRIDRREGLVAITGVLSHRDGHSEETTLELPVDSSGSKNGVQAVGSSISYGKRYTAIALLNITSRAPQDRDDDGKAAGTGETISQDQVDDLVALMDEVGADRGRFLNYMRIEGLSDIKVKDLPRAIAMLEKKRSGQ